MAESRYLDFELLVAKDGARYRAQVVEAPSGGEAATEFRLPFSRPRLEILLLRLGRPRVGVLGVDSPRMEAAREFGGQLFGAAFGGEVLACLRASLERAEREGAGLRIRLRLAGAPELADLPWEFLYDAASGHFLALAAETPIVRYLDLPQSIKPLAIRPPLRVLAAISGPPEWEPVDAEREWATLKGAFGELERDGRAVLERLERPTMDALQARLRRGEVHVFHFVGHGGFRDQKGEGVLVFEDERGGGQLVTAEELGILLRNYRSLRLVVLNACEGAKADPKDPFGGTAQKLVQQGLPAVIAMQFPITMTAAARLARTFYDALGAGYPVDRALTEARVALRTSGNELEWATPVLFLRAADGRLFDTSGAPPLPASAGHPDQTVARGPAATPRPTRTTFDAASAVQDGRGSDEQTPAHAPGYRPGPRAVTWLVIPVLMFWLWWLWLIGAVVAQVWAADAWNAAAVYFISGAVTGILGGVLARRVQGIETLGLRRRHALLTALGCAILYIWMIDSLDVKGKPTAEAAVAHLIAGVLGTVWGVCGEEIARWRPRRKRA